MVNRTEAKKQLSLELVNILDSGFNPKSSSCIYTFIVLYFKIKLFP